jgi:hypothetical protein
MELPEPIRRDVDEKAVLAHVGLGGDDAVVVTVDRTFVYRAEGLLSDESVTAYDHDAERLELRSGRRKTTFRLGYVDRTEEFTVPGGSVNDVLVPLMEGLLRHAGRLDGDEVVSGSYRFSELTLVVTDRRLLKHVGGTVWDREFDEAPFEGLTRLAFEEGSVATEMVVEVEGYPERFKVPNEHAGTVRRVLEEAVLGYHGVGSLAELEALLEREDEEDGPDVIERTGFTRLVDEESGEETTGLSDLTTGGDADDPADGDEDPGTEPAVGPDGPAGKAAVDSGTTVGARNGGARGDGPAAGGRGGASADDDGQAGPDRDALVEEVAALREAVERQERRLERQGELLKRLVEELRRGR